MSQFKPNFQQQLNDIQARFSNTFTGTIPPSELAKMQKNYGYNTQPRQTSAKDREANLQAFNTDLTEKAKAIGEMFAQNTQNQPIEQQYLAYQQAEQALARQYAQAGLSEEQQEQAMNAFREKADVWAKADEQAGFLQRAGDLASYVPSTVTTFGEQLAGLFSPNGEVRQWFQEAGNSVKDWRSDESKLRTFIANQKMQEAKERGESGFTQFLKNALENPLEATGQFAESALPTVASTVAGVAAAPITAGTSLSLPFVVGGIQGAGATRNEIYDHISKMPLEQLSQVPEYQQYLTQGLTPEQARNELASSLIEHGGEVLATGVSSAVLNRLGGLGRIGQAGKGALNSTAGKFVSEAVTEPTDEVFQQLMANKAIHDIDKTHSLTSDLGEAAAGGLLFGVAGGGIAAADSALRSENTQSAPQSEADKKIDVLDSFTPQNDPASDLMENAGVNQPTVNVKVLDEVLSPFAETEMHQELHQELIDDIQDGKLADRAKEDTEYGRLARAYLEKTEPLSPTPQALDTQSPTGVQQVALIADEVTPVSEVVQSEATPTQSEALNQLANPEITQEIEPQALRDETQSENIQAELDPVEYEDLSHLPDFEHNHDRAWKGKKNGQPFRSEQEAENSEVYQKAEEYRLNPTVVDKDGAFLVEYDKTDDVRLSRSPIKSVEANVKRGREAMNTAIAEHRTVHRAMFNHNLDGWVDFEWGDVGKLLPSGKTKGAMGIAHIIESRMRKDDMSYAQATRMLIDRVVDTIAKGRTSQIYERGNVKSVFIDYKGNRATLIKRDGSNSWLMNAFELKPTGEQVGSNDPSLPTHTLPTRQRQGMGAVNSDTILHHNDGQRHTTIQQDQQALSQILGKDIASHIQVVDSNTKMPKGGNNQSLVGSDIEGWFNPTTNKLYLVSDNITSNHTMSRDERLAWVAWHELAHKGVRVKFGNTFNNLLAEADKNLVVRNIARKIQQKHGYSKEVAIEEAMVELYAAFETGNWDEINQRYNTKIHESWKTGKGSVGEFLTKLANYFRRLISGVIGRDLTQTMSNAQVFETLRGIRQGIETFTKSQLQTSEDVRYPKNGNDDNSGEFSSENDNIRHSIKQTVDDLAKSGKAQAESTPFDEIKAGDFQSFKARLGKIVAKLDEVVADSLRPVNDWLSGLTQYGVAEHEVERLRGDMYRAKGVRDALNSDLEQKYLNPLITKIAQTAKENKLDNLSAKRLLGYWVSGRYAIEKNNELVQRNYKQMLEAEKSLEEAKKNGTHAEIEQASREYRKAEREYRYRKHDVELPLGSEAEFKIGTAGGWSNAQAANFMQNIEKHIPRKSLEETAEILYDLNQKRLEIDFQAGRYSEEQYNEYKANRHYVPLTGDPNSDEQTDIISGAGRNTINVSKDKALKGRKLSEAEDGIDASWRAIGNSTTYAGWSEFKAGIDNLYEATISQWKDKGYTEIGAKQMAEKTIGITRSKMKGTTRPSDNALIRKLDGIYYEYHLPNSVITALKNDNTESAAAFLQLPQKLSGWYARGVTQWNVTFALMNMLRDTWEKSEFIRVQKLYDKNGNRLDDKAMDQIGRAVLKNAFSKSTWKATKRFSFDQELRQDEESERQLKELLELGGISTYSTYLANTEKDLLKIVKRRSSFLASKLDKAGELISNYNQVFDNVSALSAYRAMLDAGVDKKQAAAATLELTNFRKTGAIMPNIKALYMFSQPTAMGARNLMKYLSTPKGRKRFIGYMAVMIPLYAALRGMDDEDEGGNVMDQLGDITRYIPLPLGNGKYFKIPVGFGLPQMAWNFATNIVKAGASDISVSEAATNMAVHTLKTIAPISPSEISAVNYPLQKFFLTFTPTVLQPMVQNALNRNAFGSQITPSFVREDKLKAEQSKSTTAEFWRETALWIQENIGMDMHPEQVKNLFDNYGSMLGSLKEVSTIMIENPNREQLGRRTRTPFLNQFIGTTNEFAVQSRYYEASSQARTTANEYNSRKERGKLEGWLTKDKLREVRFSEQNEKEIQALRSEKSKLTKALRKGLISKETYDARLKMYNLKMDKLQRDLLKEWRKIEGLNTK